ncbi:MAG: hypothetical protein AVDCRST_MAG54-509 [uncultured Actinomycetospora sp.]|uniref:DUF1996 domain-containing protein n=1 Tax=uncultured Actinomycetospora sp. TaxID=1135996 RepID=A0A6J4HF24_9PSEU|nr:MAG: hypothetical protein AVDCRST_MAG54-509 [uncultured Actinomycetospora sp.]
MPRRGRHRTSVPTRLIAAVAALLVTAGVVVAAGSAAADDQDGGLFSALSSDESSERSGDDQDGETGQEEESDEGSGGEESGDGSEDGTEEDGQQDGQDGADGQEQRREQANDFVEDEGEVDADREAPEVEAAEAADPFPGRAEQADADESDFVDIADVDDNNGEFGEGGRRLTGGSYTVDCGVSDHNNSDNYMAAPGKQNGAQHVHDYVGNESTDANSDDQSLEQAGTSCVNGDQSTFFWPVLRDLNGTGPDVDEDGGTLDGNRGAILRPRSAQLSFHGHGDEPVEPMPTHLMMIMGNAKQGAQGGENANAKYTCTGQEERVTSKYPICGAGSNLVRILDYPSCWDGQNLESKNFRDHMAFTDEDGNCGDGFTPVPALRITLTYDQPEGRAFQIDSFPNEQHAPETDHSDFENLATEDSNEAGAACINENRTCANLQQ